MKKLVSAFLLPFLAIQTTPFALVARAQEAAKSVQQSQAAAISLTNQDVLRMVEAEFTPETVIAQIKSSRCNFATTPAALQHLKEEGVPDSVILAMVMAPASGTATKHSSEVTSSDKRVRIRVPNGVAVEDEAPFTISSQDGKPGEAISFRVGNPVKVDGAVIIEAGSTATARVVKASRGGHFGRAGRLAWVMENVTAVDGSRIPLQTSGRLVGDSKGAKVATQMILTGVVFWVIAPVALLHGFKRGENAVLPAGKRFEVLSHGEVLVNAPAPSEN